MAVDGANVHGECSDHDLTGHYTGDHDVHRIERHVSQEIISITTYQCNRIGSVCTYTAGASTKRVHIGLYTQINYSISYTIHYPVTRIPFSGTLTGTTWIHNIHTGSGLRNK